MASQAHLRWEQGMGKEVRKDHREVLASLQGHVLRAPWGGVAEAF